ncbi:MAG: tetratricopeptide repeat protein, partial [Kofleriaceae bacterium]|nr:tetratricopeptide repeat protein [Kofleriaceae bacterium]
AAQPSVVVEAPRRRTGTPEVGVPVPELSPVAGQIEPRRAKEPSGPVAAPASGRARRASSSAGMSAPADSSSWFDDGEQASREADRIRSRKSKSPSSTDLSLYDEPAMRRRWPLLVGGLVAVGALVGTIAFAMSRGEDNKKPVETAAATPPPPPVTNVPPSEIINTDTPAPPPPSETVAETKTTPTKKSTPEPTASRVTTPKTTTPKETTTTTPKTTSPNTNVDPEDTAGRRPGGDWFSSTTPGNTTPTNTTPTNTTPTNTTPTNTTPTNTTPTPTGVSGAEGPLDPYGADPAAASADASGPEKKADFFANLGQQRLASNDTTGAAANFSKALEIDPKNVVSTIGMGEIALRQGLFGDAIAHLKKAVKLAPKSSRVFTLLGEAYLNSGNNSVAADNFKKALQLDPENARARDGYNEASSKVPPPTDE